MVTALDEAQRQYVKALRELQLADGELYGRAANDFRAAYEEAQREYQQRCTEAAETYRARQGSDSSAYNEYVTVMQRAWADAQDAVERAYAAYYDATAQAWERSCQSQRGALVDYVRGLQDWVRGWDPETVPPEALLRAASAMWTTAQWTAALPAVQAGGSTGTRHSGTLTAEASASNSTPSGGTGAKRKSPPAASEG